MVLFKNPKHSNAVRHHAQYILRQGSKDLGATTLEGSRNGMAMMVYSSLHILGRRGYELLINNSIELAIEFAEMINQHPEFELMTQPTLSLLTYRLRPKALSDLATWSESDMRKFNQKLDSLSVSVQKQQREAGKSFVSRTRIEIEKYNGQTITVFRVVLANPLTTKEHLAGILDEQLKIASKNKIWRELSSHPISQIA
jgi:glutamate decarboxylase